MFRSGLSFTASLGEVAAVSATVTVDGRSAQRYRLVTGNRARRTRSLILGRTTTSLLAGRGSMRLKLAKKHVRKLRRAPKLSLRVMVTASDAAGNATRSRRTLKFKR